MTKDRSKYAPLEGHLKLIGGDEVPMRFAEIEQVIGDELPTSARKYRPWWSNNVQNSVITKAWLNAGYKSAQVDMAAEQLVFIKDRIEDRPGTNGSASKAGKTGYHPFFGCMKGTVTIADGLDLTQPAMPEWAEMCENPKLYNE